MNKIALFGAAGAIGQSIAKAVSAQSAPYRVVGRSRDALAAAFGADSLAEIVTWNPDDPASVQAAASGVDAIVYLVGVNYWQFELHPRLMKQTLDGAIAAGVKRIVLVGTVYPYGRPRTKPLREDHPREPHTFKGRMRKAQEDLLLAAHAEGKIQATVLRLPDFYGPGVDKSFLHSAFTAAVNGGVANMIGPLDAPHEFVFVPDVGPVVARLTFTSNAYGRVWHLAGAGVTTQRAIVEEIERQIGHRLRVRVAGKTMLRLIGLFNPLMREMVEMHYLLTDPGIRRGGQMSSPAVASTNTLTPVQPEERIVVLDVLRGFALLGILTVNLPGAASSGYAWAAGLDPFPAWWDKAAERSSSGSVSRSS